MIQTDYLEGICKALAVGLPRLQEPTETVRKASRPQIEWRYVMKKFIATLALVTLIAVPTLTLPASAANVSPSSSSFGDNGY